MLRFKREVVRGGRLKGIEGLGFTRIGRNNKCNSLR